MRWQIVVLERIHLPAIVVLWNQRRIVGPTIYVPQTPPTNVAKRTAELSPESSSVASSDVSAASESVCLSRDENVS